MDKDSLWPGVSLFFGFTAIVLGCSYGFARHLSRPILALMQGVERLAKGDFSTFVDIKTHDEFQDLANAFNIMSEDLSHYKEVRVDEVVAEKAKIEGIVFSSED